MAKAAIGQICSSNSMAHNLEQCVKLVGRAASAGAKVLFLPEASDYIATSAAESLSLARPMSTSPFVTGLQSAAARHSIAVHVGIHVPVPVPVSPSPTSSSNPVVPTLPITTTTAPPTSSSPSPSTSTPIAPNPTTTTKLYNRTIYITPQGSLLESGTYDKLHLFDYGALRESSSVQAGSRFAPPFESPVGRLGSLICFDLRFPEAAVHLTSPSPSDPNSPNPSPSSPNPSPPNPPPKPAQVLLYPSAFTVPTGLAHWEVLLRARAVETQSWVVAAAQVGRHNPSSSSSSSSSPRVSYGRSLVVDPWGRVVLQLKGVRERVRVREQRGGDGGKEEEEEEEEQEDVVEWEAEDGAVGQLGVVDIDLEEWARVREKMPLVRRT
ncbi:carbon-nitrogen hydrolase [Biscogniauxia mediterranea]|nr:carbon-nitrogen hydrolase [Biscogniauxia mediterranea]